MRRLVDFWRQYEPTVAPFLHPRDAEHMAATGRLGWRGWGRPLDMWEHLEARGTRGDTPDVESAPRVVGGPPARQRGPPPGDVLHDAPGLQRRRISVLLAGP